MLTSDFYLFAAAAAALATTAPATATGGEILSARLTGAEVLAEIIETSAAGNAALMQGDIQRYSGLVPRGESFLLMSPFGGTPTRGEDLTPERIEAMGRFFRNGTHDQEVMESFVTDDMVALAVIERDHVAVGGLPAQDWALRVTLIYRREAAGWRLVHRHADPLANGVTLEQAALLGRGAMAD